MSLADKNALNEYRDRLLIITGRELALHYMITRDVFLRAMNRVGR